jgi:hypothetical protein
MRVGGHPVTSPADTIREALIGHAKYADGIAALAELEDMQQRQARVGEVREGLEWMANYNLTGTERTLHIDFQGKARQLLDALDARADWWDHAELDRMRDRAVAAEAALADAQERFNEELRLHTKALREGREAEADRDRLQAERDDLRHWNERVRTCEAHTDEIAAVGGDCLVCDRDRLAATLREILRDDPMVSHSLARAALATPEEQSDG